MSTSEFEGMFGFNDCRKRLEKVVKELEANDGAVVEASTAKRMEFHDRFQEFIDSARPRTKKDVKGLIEVAKGLRDAVLLKGIQARIAAIQARTAQLKVHTRRIQEQTKMVRDQAKLLRLERAGMVVDGLTQAVKAIERLQESLKAGGTGQELAAQLEDLVSSIKKTMTAVKPLSDPG